MKLLQKKLLTAFHNEVSNGVNNLQNLLLKRVISLCFLRVEFVVNAQKCASERQELRYS